MLMPLPTYTATRVLDGVWRARVNDAGLVAGVRSVSLAGPVREPFGDQPSTSEVFVWQNGRTVFRSLAFRSFAGPNWKGQVAVGGASGLFLWQDGRLTRCSTKPVRGELEITDDGMLLVFPYTYPPPTYASPKPESPSWSWPPSRTVEAVGRFPFLGKLISTSPIRAAYAPDGGYIRYVPGGVKDALGSDYGTYAVHAPDGDWSFPGPFYNCRVEMGRNGRVLVVPVQGRAGVWRSAVFSPLPGSLAEKPDFLAPLDVNALGTVVGTLNERATLWRDGVGVDLSKATAGPRLDEAISISDGGNILAMTVDHIPALSGGTLFLLRRGP